MASGAALLTDFVYVCPEWFQEFKTLEAYLEYSGGEEDFYISDPLGLSYFFDSVDAYRSWAEEELIKPGITLEEWSQRDLANQQLI